MNEWHVLWMWTCFQDFDNRSHCLSWQAYIKNVFHWVHITASRINYHVRPSVKMYILDVQKRTKNHFSLIRDKELKSTDYFLRSYLFIQFKTRTLSCLYCFITIQTYFFMYISEISNEYSKQWLDSSHTHNFRYLF